MRHGMTGIAIGSLSLLLAGCAEPPDDTQEIVDNLIEAGFPANDIMIVDGRVYVGRDAEVTLAASREMVEVSPGKEQYRTRNLVARSVTKICVNGSAFTEVFSTALDLAIQNYEQQPLSFAMARTPSTGCSFTINGVIQPGLVGGSAGFPSGGLPFGTIFIGDGLRSFPVDTIEHVITHEIGHTIGLRHSDFFNRSISCGSGGDEGDGGVGAFLVPGTPGGSVVGASIMNSCFRTVETGELTPTDVAALSALYGPVWPGLNNDGRADVCGRGGGGIFCALSTGTGFGAVALWQLGFGDAEGWNAGPQYYSTIQFPDVNGDGRHDVCGRGAAGIHCAVSSSTSTGTPGRLWHAGFSDAAGWAAGPQYYSTIKFPDVNGDGRADVCGRGAGGITCALSTGAGFGTASVWQAGFRDAAGWAAGPQYYSTIQFPDVNGDGRADVCGRGAAGITCVLSTGTGFGTTAIRHAGYSDANGWAAGPEYYSTIQFPDMNGDGRADVCGRGSTGIQCALSAGTSFGTATLAQANFGDPSGWNAGPQYYSTIQFPDVNGDRRRDVCGRGTAGITCALSNGTGFGVATLMQPAFGDAFAWSFGPQYYSTIRFP